MRLSKIKGSSAYYGFRNDQVDGSNPSSGSIEYQWIASIFGLTENQATCLSLTESEEKTRHPLRASCRDDGSGASAMG